MTRWGLEMTKEADRDDKEEGDRDDKVRGSR